MNVWRFVAGLAAGLAVIFTTTPAVLAQPAPAGERVIYQTGFEFAEGYNPDLLLVGQQGWVGVGTGGNGLLAGAIPESGWQAYIGFSPPSKPTEAYFNVLRPADFIPAATGPAMIKFQVTMQIFASTNGHRDDFRWSAYNTNGARLLSIDFDGTSQDISYSLDQPTDFVRTGFTYDNLGPYRLEVWMDYRRNAWRALLNDVIIVNSKPITARNAALNFGDFDAVWAIRDPARPGDNYMVFDDYRISVSDAPSFPPVLQTLSITAGVFTGRVFGQDGLNYHIESSADLRTWRLERTIQAPAGGIFEFEDAAVRTASQRFFRVRQAP